MQDFEATVDCLPDCAQESLENLQHELQCARDELQQYQAFITKARRESELVEWHGEFKVLMPYWVMRDMQST